MRKSKFLIFSILIIILDQISKFYLTNKNVRLTNFLYFNYVENTGAAFSIFQNQKFLLILISVVVFLVLIYYFIKLNNNILLIGISFLFGGILGNLIDRIYFGYVRDFIDLKIWPVFNIADSFNTVGAVLLAYYLIKGKDI